MRRAEFGAATEHDVEIETSAGRRTSAIAIEAAANR